MPAAPYITAADPASFGAFTFRERLPRVLAQVRANLPLTPAQADALQALVAAIHQNMPLPPVDTARVPASAGWARFNQTYAGQTATEIPFAQVEAWFYTQIGIVLGYDADHTLDPFAPAKQEALHRSLPLLAQAAQAAQAHLAQAVPLSTALPGLLQTNLYGNTADLSQLAAHQRTHVAKEHLLLDRTPALARYLEARRPLPRIDWLADNAGLELGLDLVLIHYLLASGTARQVVLHVKHDPTFVSDATAQDVARHLQTLAESHLPALQTLADALRNHQAQGRLRLEDHPFWNGPWPFAQMPAEFAGFHTKNDVSSSPSPRKGERGSGGEGVRPQGSVPGGEGASSLPQQAGETFVPALWVVKGDANYRRLLDDRAYPPDTPLAELLGYLPVPALMLRMLKSEMVAGLPTGLAERLSAQDPAWRTNGQWGLIDFWQPA